MEMRCGDRSSKRGKPMCPAVEIWRRAQKCARHRPPRAGAAPRRAEHLDRRPGVRGVEADLAQEERERRAQHDGGGDDEHARERDRALPRPTNRRKGRLSALRAHTKVPNKTNLP